MPFYFKRKESVRKAVRRLCGERIGDALKCLRSPNHLEGVHEVRKEIKKLRAVLRLVRGEIGKKVYRKNVDALRDASNRLTALRDAHVKLKAVDELAEHFRRQLPACSFPEIKNTLQENCRREERKFLKVNSVRIVEQILKKLKKPAADLQLESDDWDAICLGLMKSCRRGREAFETARTEPLPENFHEWRKRVKDLWLQLKLFCPAQPQKLGATAKKLESLGDSLGDDHDLFLLAGFVAGGNLDCAETEAIKKLICRRQKELSAAALKAGADFYSEKPNRFCSRIEDYWKRWRKE